MIWPAIRFIWQETLLELRRERLIAITTVSTVAVLLILLGINLLFVLDLRVWARSAEREVEVSAYFEDRLSRVEAQRIAGAIAAWPEVDSARFMTREELWNEKATKIVDMERLKGLDASIFPDSVRIRAKSASLVGAVRTKLKTTEGVETVVPDPSGEAQNGHVARFITSVVQFQRVVSWAGLVVGLLVAVVGIFVVHNTIRLAFHARWREVYIMQLVGATRGLIAAPFVLQGMIHGAIGAVLACCLLVPLHMYLGHLVLHSQKAFLRLQPDAALLPFAVYLVIGGAALGLVGSALSIRRTLRHRPEWQS